MTGYEYGVAYLDDAGTETVVGGYTHTGAQRQVSGKVRKLWAPCPTRVMRRQRTPWEPVPVVEDTAVTTRKEQR
jgi:hypothetical protein